MANLRTRSHIVLAVLALVVIGCGQSGGEEAEGSVQITVWEQASGLNEVVEEKLAEFNESQDEIEAEYVVTASEEFEENLAVAFRTDQEPDIFTTNQPRPKMEAGWTLPLSDQLSEETLTAYGPYLEGKFDYIQDGIAHSVPRSANPVRLMINSDLYEQAGLNPEQPPEDLNELTDAARAITEATNGEAYGFAASMAWGGFYEWQSDPIIQASNPNLTNLGLFNMESQEFEMERYAPYIEMIRTMQADGSLFPGASSLDRDPTRAAFANGEVAMYLGSSFEVGVMNEQLETDVPWIAVRIPTVPGEEFQRSIMNAGVQLSVASSTENVEESVEVLEYLVGSEVITALTETGVVFPLHPDAQDESLYPEDQVGYEAFVPKEYDQQWPPRPMEVLEFQGEPFSDVVTRLMTSDEEIEQALAELNDRFTQVYQEAVESGDIDPERYQP